MCRLMCVLCLTFLLFCSLLHFSLWLSSSLSHFTPSTCVTVPLVAAPFLLVLCLINDFIFFVSYQLALTVSSPEKCWKVNFFLMWEYCIHSNYIQIRHDLHGNQPNIPSMVVMATSSVVCMFAVVISFLVFLLLLVHKLFLWWLLLWRCYGDG